MTNDFSPIPDYPKYSMSKEGVVKRFRRVLRAHEWNGTMRVKLSKNGVRKSHTIKGLLKLVYG